MPLELRSKVDSALVQSQALRLRAQPDSARNLLGPILAELGTKGYEDSPIFRRVQLEQSINYTKSAKHLLALETINKVVSSSCDKVEWATCAAAKLEWMVMELAAGEKGRSRELL
ncbi:MAG: hypothetical protein AAGF89_12785, partial [Bacteroidota bacterium]